MQKSKQYFTHRTLLLTFLEFFEIVVAVLPISKCYTFPNVSIDISWYCRNNSNFINKRKAYFVHIKITSHSSTAVTSMRLPRNEEQIFQKKMFSLLPILFSFQNLSKIQNLISHHNYSISKYLYKKHFSYIIRVERKYFIFPKH